MMFSDITNAVSGAQNAITSIGGALSGGGGIPGTTSVPSGGSSSYNGAAVGGISFLGAVVIYFVLKITGLLPRWARII